MDVGLGTQQESPTLAKPNPQGWAPGKECSILLLMEWLFSWEVTSWTVGILVAVAFAVIALKDFRLAKLLFLLAAADAIGGIEMTVVKSPLISPMKWLLAFALAGLVGLATCACFLYTDGKKGLETVGQGGDSQKPAPPVQQTSQGNNSPNTAIIGNNNTVTYSINSSDPRVIAKLDEIKKLIQQQRGNDAKPSELLKRYPLGYVVFDIDQQSSVFPYATQSLLSEWDFDWRAVKIKEDQGMLFITFPSMFSKSKQFSIVGGSIGAPKKVGPFDGIFFRSPDMSLKSEILAIRPNGIIFLIGFDYGSAHQAPK